jgi:hypothetical protein
MVSLSSSGAESTLHAKRDLPHRSEERQEIAEALLRFESHDRVRAVRFTPL